MARFDEEIDTEEGWAKTNRHYWLRDYPGYIAFFMAQMFPEPHSSKQIEDTVGWGLNTTPEVLIATMQAPALSEEYVRELASRVTCPVLVLHGSDDRQSPAQRAGALATAARDSSILLEGSGRAPHARDPVRINLLLREFIDSIDKPRRSVRWPRGRSRIKRALYVSSPIGLGHARRDVCRARKRDQHRGLEEGRDEDAYFAPVGSSEIVHLPRRYRLMDWSNSDGLTGSFQAAREYSVMRP